MENDNNTNWDKFAQGFGATAQTYEGMSGTFKMLEGIAKEMKSTIDANTEQTREVKKSLDTMAAQHNRVINKTNKSIEKITEIAENATEQTAKTTEEQWKKSLSDLNVVVVQTSKLFEEKQKEIDAQFDKTRRLFLILGIVFGVVLAGEVVICAMGAWWLMTAWPAIQQFFATAGWVVGAAVIILFIVALVWCTKKK